jgi:hypothetical protein
MRWFVICFFLVCGSSSFAVSRCPTHIKNAIRNFSGATRLNSDEISHLLARLERYPEVRELNQSPGRESAEAWSVSIKDIKGVLKTAEDKARNAPSQQIIGRATTTGGFCLFGGLCVTTAAIYGLVLEGIVRVADYFITGGSLPTSPSIVNLSVYQVTLSGMLVGAAVSPLFPREFSDDVLAQLRLFPRLPAVFKYREPAGGLLIVFDPEMYVITFPNAQENPT